MRDIIEKETWNLLDTYARTGRFTPDTKITKKGKK